jgi:hypothetical protein
VQQTAAYSMTSSAEVSSVGTSRPSALAVSNGFREAGGGALTDYEILELNLFQAIPGRDVKAIAKALIKRFGGFAEATPRRARRWRASVASPAASPCRLRRGRLTSKPEKPSGRMRAAERRGRPSCPGHAKNDNGALRESIVAPC